MSKVRWGAGIAAVGLLLSLGARGWAEEVLVAPDAQTVETGSPAAVQEPDEPVIHDPEAEPDAADEEEAQTLAPEPTPVPFRTEHGGLGLSLGKGGGLFGVYAYARPFDHFALEGDFGSRLFLFAITDGNTTSDVEVYWPMTGAVKAQFFFAPRDKRFQPGIELGVLAAEDMGLGGDIAGVVHLRLAQGLALDANLGVGFFPDVKSKTIDYLVKVRGKGLTRAYYEDNVELLTMPVMLMWGVGLSFVF